MSAATSAAIPAAQMVRGGEHHRCTFNVIVLALDQRRPSLRVAGFGETFPAETIGTLHRPQWRVFVTPAI